MSEPSETPVQRKGSTTTRALYLVVMILVVIGVDLAFFRGSDHTWERLVANILIVAAFGLTYVKLFGLRK